MLKPYYLCILFCCFLFGEVTITKSQTGCNLALIRQTFTGAGCTELTSCLSSCSMYFYNPLSQTGNAAQAWAQNYGANLISLQSGAENACIVSELNTYGFGGIIWIGFNDVANEGGHVWYDQSAVIYTNWNAGEPNNSANEDCVQIYPDGKWNDLDCSSGGSKSVIEVNLCPTATITASALSICAGQSVNLAASTILGSSPYTYNWTSTSGIFSSTAPALTVTPGTTTTYSVTSTDRYGCTASTSVQITVNTSLNATIGGTTAVCKNESAPNITCTGNSGTAPYTFTYTINSGAAQTVSTSSGNSVNVPVFTGNTGVFTYALMNVSDANGCSQAQSGNATVTITALPTATISGTATVCMGGTAVITFTGSGGITPYTFTYSINGAANQTVNSGSGNDGTVTVPTGTAGTYTYTLVSVQSASSATCAQPQSGNAVVTVNNSPTAAITGTTAVCKDATSPNITFTGANGTAPYTFTYTINGGSNQTITTTSGNSVILSAPTNTAGTFTYALVNVADAGLVSCSQAQSGSAIITVKPVPTAALSGTATICKDEPLPNIILTGSGGTAPYTFTYTINSGASQTITTSSGNNVNVFAPTGNTGVFSYDLLSVADISTCSQAQSGSAVITVIALPTATISGTVTVCKNGNAPDITFTGTGGITPYTFTYTINGGANQTVNSSSGNNGTVSVPTGTAGTYTYTLVTVQSASSTTCAQAQSGSAVVTVNPLPTAAITGTATVCKDAASPTITFTGTNVTAPYTFTYTITGGTNQTITTTSGNSATVYAPTNAAGTFTYTLTNVADGGIVSCSQAQSGSALVTVYPLPTATLSGTTTICKDAQAPDITFTGAAGTAPYTFTYKVNGVTLPSVTTNTGNSITVSVPTSVTGVFTYQLVSVQDANSCMQLQNGSVVITINSLPTAIITGTTAVCKDAALPNVTFTGANGLAPYTFTYTINGGVSQTVITTVGSSVAVPASTTTTGVFTYSLISVQDANSSICMQPQSGSAVITVNTLPTATIAGTTTVCKNAGNPSITFIGSGTTPPYTFVYTINNGASQTVTSPNGSSIATVTANTTIAGVFNYSLISVQDASQTTCLQAQSGSAIITVNPLPTGTITGSISICEDEPSPFITLTGAGATAPYTFTYTLNGGTNQIISTTSGNSVSISAPTSSNGSFVYSLLNIAESSATTCAQAQNETATVTVNPKPIVDFSTANTSGCEQFCIFFTDQSSIPTGTNSSVMWDFGDGIIDPTPNHCYTNGTVYSSVSFNVSLTATSDSGCVNSLTKTNYITVYPKPIANFTIDPTVANIVNPVISSTNLSLGATLWNWNYGDADTSDLQNPLPHTYADTGIYQITLVAASQFNCMDTSYQSVVIEPNFIFYIPSAFSPNEDGTNDLFLCKGVFAADFEMKIFDRWGNMVFSSNNIDVSWDGKANKGAEFAQQGVYVYSIKVTDINNKKHDYKGIVTLVR